MINPSDLRLNNLFSHQGKIKKVFSISQTGVMATDLEDSNVASSCPMEEIEPIQISDEWLLRFGGKIQFAGDILKEYLFENQDPNKRIVIRGLMMGWCFYNHNQYHSGKQIITILQFVHEFQNIYRWAAGQELEISPESTECKTCGGNCKPGKALKNETIYGEPDIVGKRTVYEGEGEAKIKDVLKCQDCGHSFIPKQKTLPKGRVKNVN